MAVNPDQGETVGWPRFIDTVGTAWRTVPTAERARTAIFTSNYGEAGAVDVLGVAKGLPARLQRPQRLQRVGQPPARRHPCARDRIRRAVGRVA